ncbi:MAG: ferredoxin family protein [Deltaproteobacteria bacterium]|nr:ferredoxin family protein [Deltaproteobacteria bacterium]
MATKAVVIPNLSRNGKVIEIDPDKCTGCNRCVEACRSDVFIPNVRKGKPPLVIYPDECWYCGCCVQECAEGALMLLFPLYHRVAVVWKDRETSELRYLKINKKIKGKGDNQ